MNIFQQFVKSLYSPKDIAGFRNQKIGKTILYITILSLFAMLPVFIHLIQTMNLLVHTVEHTLKNDVPDFEIQNGQLITENKQPIIIEQDHNVFFIFDNTGEYTPEQIEKEKNNTVAILRNHFVFQINGQTETLPYSDLGINKIAKMDLEEMVDSVKPFLIVFYIIFFILFLVIQFATHLVAITVLAAGGLLFKNLMGRKVLFGELWNMSAYAITLITVFFIIMDFLKVTVPFATLIRWGVMGIMLFLAVKELPKVKTV